MSIESIFGDRIVAESSGSLLADILGRQHFPIPLISTSPFEPIPRPSNEPPCEGYDSSTTDAPRQFVLQQLDRSLAHGHITEADRARLASLYDQVPDLGDRTDVPDHVAKSRAAVARLRQEASEDAAASAGAVTLLSVAEKLWEAIEPPVTDTKSDFHDFVVTVGAVQGAIAGGIAGLPAGPVGVLLGGHAGAHAGAAVSDAVYQATESIFS